MPRAWRSRDIWGWLVDLTVLAAAWWLAIEGIRDLFSNNWLSGLLLALIAMLIPAANSVWLQIRIAPRIVRLSNRALREELAVTLLPARKYLWKRLRAPLVRALLPTLTTLPVLLGYVLFCADLLFWLLPTLTTTPVLLGTLLLKEREEAIIVAIVFIVWLAGGMLLISLYGLGDLLLRQCRATRPNPFGAIVTPLIWSILAIAAPSLLTWLGFYALSFRIISETTFVMLCVILMAVSLGWLVRRVFVHWQLVCGQYYRFE